MRTLKTNWREKTLDDFEVADSLDDHVLPSQKAICLMNPLCRPFVLSTFGDLKGGGFGLLLSTLISNKQNQWNLPIRLTFGWMATLTSTMLLSCGLTAVFSSSLWGKGPTGPEVVSSSCSCGACSDRCKGQSWLNMIKGTKEKGNIFVGY